MSCVCVLNCVVCVSVYIKRQIRKELNVGIICYDEEEEETCMCIVKKCDDEYAVYQRSDDQQRDDDIFYGIAA